jgi:hypothetical protein
MKNRITPVCCLITLVCASVPARADEVQTIIRHAIDATDGTAKGVVVGPIAERFKATFKINAPVLMDVSTVKVYKQEGCRRLALRIYMPGGTVADKNGQAQPIEMKSQLNMCRDGNPPSGEK